MMADSLQDLRRDLMGGRCPSGWSKLVCGTYADLFPDDLDAVGVALDAAASQQVALKVRSRD